MTIRLSNLTIEAAIESRNGSTHYEVLSVRDELGNSARSTPALLDEIEEAIENELLCRYYDDLHANAEMPHLMGLYF